MPQSVILHEKRETEFRPQDDDPYVRKTAAICVAKLHDINAEMVEDRGFLEQLQVLLLLSGVTASGSRGNATRLQSHGGRQRSRRPGRDPGTKRQTSLRSYQYNRIQAAGRIKRVQRMGTGFSFCFPEAARKLSRYLSWTLWLLMSPPIPPKLRVSYREWCLGCNTPTAQW